MAVDGLTAGGPPDKHRRLRQNTPSTPQESCTVDANATASVKEGSLGLKVSDKEEALGAKGDGTSQGESFGAEAYQGGSGRGNLQI